MNAIDMPPVPRFDRMIRSIVQLNAILVVILLIAGYITTRSSSLVVGIAVGAALATVNALLLARTLRQVTLMPDPSGGQLAMMGSLVVRFAIMGAGMAFAVLVLRIDKFGIGGLLGAMILFQVISGWHASRGARS